MVLYIRVPFQAPNVARHPYTKKGTLLLENYPKSHGPTGLVRTLVVTVTRTLVVTVKGTLAGTLVETPIGYNKWNS